MDQDEEKVSINIATYNCNGIKSSHNYVKSLVESNDITFICEHWMAPNKTWHYQTNIGNQWWCKMKSSIQPGEVLNGRPYGGTGIICKKIHKLFI
jgi:hypothetical protein